MPPPAAGSAAGHVVAGIVAAAMGAVVAMAVVGVPLAVGGWFRPVLVLPVIGLGAVAGVLALRPALGGLRTPMAPVAVVVLGVGLVTGASLVWPSQHTVVNRDPGAYTVTAHWLAEHGDLLVVGLEGPFAEAAGLEPGSFAFIDDGRADGRLYAQFPHLNASVLAASRWIGGDRAMVRLTPMVGAVAMLALFVLLRLHVRPMAAAVATLVLTVSLPQVWFSRDTYSEPLAQLLLFGGLAVLTVGLRQRRLPLVALAALSLGAVVSARIDGVVFLAPLAVAAWVLATAPGWGRRAAATLVAGVTVPAVIGFVDVALRSPVYLRQHWSVVLPPLVAAASALVVTPAVLVAVRRVPSLATWRDRLVAWAAAAGPWAVVVVVLGLWLVRPRIQTVREEPAQPWLAALAADEGIADQARVYSEQSVEWISWYLGPVAVAAAVAGAAIAVGRALRRGDDVGLVLWLLGPAALVYWWRPSIAPDHLWVMRRYLTAALPLVVLGIGVALDWLWDQRHRRPRVAGPLAVAVAAAAVGVPALITLPLADARELQLSQHTMGLLCDSLGPDAAAVFLQGFGVDEQLPVAARVACQIPTAAGDPGRDYGALAEAWAAQGRRLVLVGSVAGDPHGRSVLDTVEYPVQFLESTVSRRPTDLVQVRGALNLYAP